MLVCDVTNRPKSSSNVVYDSFQEVNSKAELLVLIPKVDDFIKLAHSRGAQVIVRSSRPIEVFG